MKEFKEDIFCELEGTIYQGNLKIDKNIELTLLGCFNAPEDLLIIHCTTLSGKKITIFDSQVTNRTRSIPGYPSITFSSLYCFFGDHLLSDDLFFKKASLKISGLDRWININGFNVTSEGDSYSAEYKKPDDIIFYNSGLVKFSIHFRWTAPLFPSENLTLIQNALVHIEHEQGFTLKDFWKYCSSVKSFLTLAYYSEPEISDIQLEKDKTSIGFRYLGQFDNDSIKEKKSRLNFLFTYDMIKEDIEMIFDKWHDLYDNIGPVIYNMQEFFNKRAIVLENKFLNVMQAIETFHRRRRLNEKEPKAVHKQKIKAIIDSVPSEYKNWLNEKLSFSNEPSLHSRLECLFAEIDDILRKRFFGDYKDLITKSKNSRNYYTHYDVSMEKKALKGEELFFLTQRLNIFLLILLLKETGISNEKVVEIINMSSRFLYNHLIIKE